MTVATPAVLALKKSVKEIRQMEEDLNTVFRQYGLAHWCTYQNFPICVHRQVVAEAATRYRKALDMCVAEFGLLETEQAQFELAKKNEWIRTHYVDLPKQGRQQSCRLQRAA